MSTLYGHFSQLRWLGVSCGELLWISFMGTPSPHFLCRSILLRALEQRFSDLPLMERAGAAAADLAANLARGRSNGPVLVLVGPGNNGGDGLVVARRLRQQFFDVHVVSLTEPSAFPTDAATACQRFLAEGGTFLWEIPSNTHWQLIVDALFGIGLQRPPVGPYRDWIEAANRVQTRLNCPLLSLDCPSGLNADTGFAFTPCIRATHTLSFLADKPGLHTLDGPDFSGSVQVTDLGIPETETSGGGQLLSYGDFGNMLPRRPKNSHKGSFGSVAVLGGAKGMVGAAIMAARAALYSGAGRVFLAPLDQESLSIDALHPEIMFRTPGDISTLPLSALVVGPGMGASVGALRALDTALCLDIPLVLDADGLNLLAREGNLKVLLAQRASPTLLTPHPLEAARLLETSVEEVQGDRIEAALALAKEYQSLVALKGCGTVLASPTGLWWINSSGNPGMASGGMGDVLSGLLGALLAQGLDAQEAIKFGVALHGAAADHLVRQGHGPVGLTASETILAIRQLLNA